jgi:hypothetical protein
MGTLGNIMADIEKKEVTDNLITMIYSVSNPRTVEAGTNIRRTSLDYQDYQSNFNVLVDVKFNDHNEYKSMVCNGVIFDSCTSNEECSTIIRYILAKIPTDIWGWYYPEKLCQGVYFTKNIQPDNGYIIYYVISWLVISLLVVILWRICCIKNYIMHTGEICCNRATNNPIQTINILGQQPPNQLSLRLYDNQTELSPAGAAPRDVIIRELTTKEDEEGDMCIISMERIPKGGYYCECPTCKKVYTYTNIHRWLATRQQCPHCRCPITSSGLRMYQNGDNIMRYQQEDEGV